ncbi:MAG: DUF6148 family protein [Enterococcus lemanii]|jgi:hypothetical protein
MTSVNTLKLRLEVKKTALDEANKAYLALLSGGVKSYGIGSRTLTRLDLPQLEDTISKLEKEIDYLEIEIAGGKRRRAVGVIPRDW